MVSENPSCSQSFDCLLNRFFYTISATSVAKMQRLGRFSFIYAKPSILTSEGDFLRTMYRMNEKSNEEEFEECDEEHSVDIEKEAEE